MNKIIEERKRIGERLSEIRKGYGITQKSLGDSIGIDQDAISKVESGKRSARLDFIIKMANALGAQLDFFKKE